ncbi:MAG: hypothetical protein JXM74_03410, partial [Fusobacteriaceae bacterium]|nr:hypothetical protein [Fusobacteriaceae bacterium]
KERYKEEKEGLSEKEQEEYLAKLKEENKKLLDYSEKLGANFFDEPVESFSGKSWDEIKKEGKKKLEETLKKLGFSQEKTMAFAGYITACNMENKVAGSVNQVMQENSAKYRTDGVLTIDEYAKKYKISKEEYQLLKEVEKSEQNKTTWNLFGQVVALTMAGNQFVKWEKLSFQRSLVNELKQAGTKITEQNLVSIIKNNKGKIIWLEIGNEKAGLEHILSHSADFVAKGVPKNEISNLIMSALKENKVVGYQGKGTGRPIYETMYKGKKLNIAITVGENGFVVGANPTTIK